MTTGIVRDAAARVAAEARRRQYSIEVAGFIPAQLSAFTILGVFFGVSAIVVGLTWIYSRRLSYLKSLERMLMCWWAFTGLIHIILEGYFAFTPDFYKRKDVHFLAEVWKEYSKGDSRYASRDPTIVTVEAMTAVFVGPGCLLSAYAIAKRKHYQYPLQLIVSLAQLYGDIVYYGTVFVDGREFAAPGFLYYWFYFMFLNSIWILVPASVAVWSWKRTCESVLLSKKLA